MRYPRRRGGGHELRHTTMGAFSFPREVPCALYLLSLMLAIFVPYTCDCLARMSSILPSQVQCAADSVSQD